METYLFLDNKKYTKVIFIWNSVECKGLKKQKFLQLHFWVLPFLKTELPFSPLLLVPDLGFNNPSLVWFIQMLKQRC